MYKIVEFFHTKLTEKKMKINVYLSKLIQCVFRKLSCVLLLDISFKIQTKSVNGFVSLDNDRTGY